MDCINPIYIDNPDYDRNSAIAQPERLPVPCGRCPSCIVSSSNEWRVRLELEWRHSSSAWFVTLTYTDEKVPLGVCTDSFGNSSVLPVVSKKDVQLFFKRLRKVYADTKLRYFLVSEYGPGTFRPHYHFIIYGLPNLYNDRTKERYKLRKKIAEIWGNGNVELDDVTFGRISYVTKYISCITELPECIQMSYPPFRLMSRNPGIGYGYMLHRDRIDWHRKNLACYYPDGQFRRKLPRYLKDKIFDDAMKLEIKEQITDFRNEQLQKNLANCRNYNYSSYWNYLDSQKRRLERKFNQKYVKNHGN